MVGSSAVSSNSFKVTTPSDQEIRMTRLFDAPRRLVFEAMTKPEHVRRWWGCLGEGYAAAARRLAIDVKRLRPPRESATASPGTPSGTSTR